MKERCKIVHNIGFLGRVLPKMYFFRAHDVHQQKADTFFFFSIILFLRCKQNMHVWSDELKLTTIDKRTARSTGRPDDPNRLTDKKREKSVDD